jgi:uncharacterized 2Fe-2S/4Fe-4S cluster protein (DUF4445 family)
MSDETVRIRLEPLAVEVDVPRGAPLLSSLANQGVEFPCGGTGICGGCGLRVLAGALPVTEADRAAFTLEEIAGGWRLACQAQAPGHTTGTLVLECQQWHMDVLTDNAGLAAAGKRGLGIAIDLGTTTMAAQMIDLAAGTILGVETELNPQARFGADVMSRIRAALEVDDLTTVVRALLGEMITRLAHGRAAEIVEVVLVGNTVMHHLFSGCDVEPLSHAPFVSPHLGTQKFTARQLGWALPESCAIWFARCLGGFVGSDILAGIVATGMGGCSDLTALVDLGTNGEIAIGNREGIVCASTAAGPAFEAGAIRMGMRAVTGAIAHVSLVGAAMQSTVIGDGSPRGICGSGLVDAVAAGLRSGSILPSGRIADGTKIFAVAGPVVLYQADIRELQLAKAAIAAGFALLVKRLGAGVADVKRIDLAGAFGNYVQRQSAARIGLIDIGAGARCEAMHAAGNTALRGAKMLLLADREPELPPIEHVSLAADAGFQDAFTECMGFPEHGDA